MSRGYGGAGVYVFRTRRPGMIGLLPWWLGIAGAVISWGALATLHEPQLFALLALLVNSRHFAYVGESKRVGLRKMAHLKGSVKYNQPAKPWADLDPSWYFLPLPGAPKFVLHAVETLLIGLLWPVYNHQKNLWNLRRIPLKTALNQRVLRAGIHWSFNCRPAHVIGWVAFAGFLFVNRGALL